MKRILVIDNYDSFVHNILQLLEEECGKTEIVLCMNDNIPLARLGEFDGLVLSPGPGKPEEAHQLCELVGKALYSHPILGICLGHQALAQVLGARLSMLEHPLHGHQSVLKIIDGNDPLLQGLPQPAKIGRYHSWVVDKTSLPPDLAVSSIAEDGEIMSFYHRSLPIHGLQFHPESHLSDCGRQIVRNWVSLSVNQ